MAIIIRIISIPTGFVSLIVHSNWTSVLGDLKPPVVKPTNTQQIRLMALKKDVNQPINLCQEVNICYWHLMAF